MRRCPVQQCRRYMNGGYVSEEKKRRIRAVIEETGYRPSVQARTLRTKRACLVGVIVPKINSESISRITEGIGQIFVRKRVSDASDNYK
ncbi:MAG: hypothetical protein ACLUJR_03300 [Mediterraneibacter gnavus]